MRVNNTTFANGGINSGLFGGLNQAEKEIPQTLIFFLVLGISSIFFTVII